jgi:hypothetical protein
MVLHGSASYKLVVPSLLLTSSRILHTLLYQDEIQRRIPAVVHPWYVHQISKPPAELTPRTDPESLEWCSFDDEYRTKLDRNPYVSLSREKRLADQARSRQDADADADAVENGPQPGDVSKGEQTQDKPSPTTVIVPLAASVVGDADYELDSEPSDEDIEIPEGSLFDYNMPGVLKAEEVTKLDLDHWKLLVRNMLIDFEVRLTPSFLS